MRSKVLVSCAVLALSACGNNDVRVVFSTRRGLVTGSSTEVASSDLPARVALLPANEAAPLVATITQNVASVAGAGGGPHVLELRYAPDPDHPMDPQFIAQYPIGTARSVRMGGDYWGRANAAPFADNGRLTLSVTPTSALVAKDLFSWISLRSYFYRSVRFVDGLTHMGAPAVGATSTSGWAIPAADLIAPYGSEASGLPASESNDDLLLLHTRATKLARQSPEFDPWNIATFTRVIGVLPVTGASFTNAGANLVAGMMTAPTMAPTTVNFRASSFDSLRSDDGIDGRARMTATLSMDQEAGNGPGYLTSVAVPNWSLSAKTDGFPANPTCYPDANNECPDPSCGGMCDRTITGVRDPGDLSYTFDAPRVHTSGMRDVLTATVRFERYWTDPATSHAALLTATSTITRLASAAGPIELTVHPVTSIRVGEAQPLTWAEVVAVGDAPVVRFTAPASAAEYYVVSVLDLFPVGANADDTRLPSVVARLVTRETSVRIPSGVLRDGALYALRIASVRDGRDFSQPSVTMRDELHRTEVFTPVFKR